MLAFMDGIFIRSDSLTSICAGFGAIFAEPYTDLYIYNLMTCYIFLVPRQFFDSTILLPRDPMHQAISYSYIYSFGFARNFGRTAANESSLPIISIKDWDSKYQADSYSDFLVHKLPKHKRRKYKQPKYKPPKYKQPKLARQLGTSTTPVGQSSGTRKWPWLCSLRTKGFRYIHRE